MILRRRLTPITVVAVLLCALHAWMAASVSRQFSTTADEIVHLTAGYAYWTTGDFRLQPENGNLPQRWAALPLLFQDLKFPAADHPAWKSANTWELGDAFFHESGNDLPHLLATSRAMIAVLSAVLCWAVFVYARRLFGVRAGCAALVLAVFSPTLLAHGGLTTSDTAAGLGFLVALFTCWDLLQAITPRRAVVAGVAVGLLALSKYSVVLFAPIGLGLAMIRLLRPAPIPLRLGRHRWKLRGSARIIAVMSVMLSSAAICVAMIWAAYHFRYAAGSRAAMRGFVQSWERVLLEVPPQSQMTMADGRVEEPTHMQPGFVQHIVQWGRVHHALPEAYLYGLAFVEKNARGRLAFFAGEYGVEGWRSFFPTAFLVKTTLPALLLMSAGIVALFAVPGRRRTIVLYRISPLLVFLPVYWAFSIQSHLNIGHRHLLPTYPACFILAVACVPWAARSRAKLLCIGALLAWHVCESFLIRPDYLAYFNPIGGGPTQAHRLLVDSSLDWGQDLPRLKTWLDAHAAGEKQFLSYFGSGSPSHTGIHATRVGDAFFDGAGRATPAKLTGGVYCLSATMFRRVYTHVRGPWSPSYENAYQRLDTWLRSVPSRSSGKPVLDVDGTPLSTAVINDRLFEYEQLQFGRLCHFLAQREPDARVGFSILVFRLSDTEVATALRAPLPSK